MTSNSSAPSADRSIKPAETSPTINSDLTETLIIEPVDDMGRARRMKAIVGYGRGCRDGRDEARRAPPATGSDKRRPRRDSCVVIRQHGARLALDLDRSRRPQPNTSDPRA